MRKLLWLLPVVALIFWVIVALMWAGTEKPPKDYDFPAATNTEPTREPEKRIVTPEATNSATPSAFFEASSSTIRLVAPTISIEYRY